SSFSESAGDGAATEAASRLSVEAEAPTQAAPRPGPATSDTLEPIIKVPASARRRYRPRRHLLMAIAAAFLLLGGLIAANVVFRWQTRDGILELTVEEPDVEVFIDGEQKLVIDSKKLGMIELKPGKHNLAIKRDKEIVYTDTFTL